MKSLRTAIIAASISLALIGSASAGEIPESQNSSVEKVSIEKFSEYYQPIVSTFGCSEFAWGSYVQNHKLISLEYVPPGDNVNSWTRLMTVTLYPLPQEKTAQIETMQKMSAAILKGYSNGKIIQESTYSDAEGRPRLFVEYEIGEGLMKEHNAGTFSMTYPNAATLIQIQTRGKPFAEQDAANMKLFAEGKLPIVKPN